MANHQRNFVCSDIYSFCNSELQTFTPSQFGVIVIHATKCKCVTTFKNFFSWLYFATSSVFHQVFQSFKLPLKSAQVLIKRGQAHQETSQNLMRFKRKLLFIQQGKMFQIDSNKLSHYISQYELHLNFLNQEFCVPTGPQNIIKILSGFQSFWSVKWSEIYNLHW